jgi:hypothetical protein
MPMAGYVNICQRNQLELNRHLSFGALKQRKINLNTIGRLLILCITVSLIVVAAGCATLTHSKPGTTTTIILTRHGDRDPLAEELNDQGRQRAEALVGAVADMNITAIYSPDMKRNLDTAQPLAKHLGIKVEILGPAKNEVTTTILSRHPGEVVIWIGNINNLKGIYALLGGEGAPPITYGDLYIVEVKDSGDPVVTKERYGPS